MRPEFGARCCPSPSTRAARGLEAPLEELRQGAVQAVDSGATLLILSDREVGEGRAAIPALLATGAVHHHLIREGKRMRADLIVQTGEAWDIHHLACLIGYGAGAVHPYLALASSRAFAGQRASRPHPRRSWRRATGRPRTRACSGSCPRWASPPSRPTAGRRSSRPWASARP